ncbi:TIGR03086 family protein [Kribbella sp. ALI-6-A]|uniref:TIGR03086 family metal-binding protein n=1 Tax=Kribbella sp. ALI-6-A TaxID=1933817 RepID=UPI00097C74EA|nr:TIGR03086 family metal-binding protein [Kribbella sp. ALI-6-A]ONI69090.1 TIGR03086 family protein [Kribbella sp. ALI-6-A]
MDLLPLATVDFLGRVSAVPEDGWDRDTPCGISVREVVDHVVAGNLFAVRLLGGASAAEATAGLGEGHLGDDPVAAVRATGEDQLKAFQEADRSAVLHHPSRDIDYDTFVRFRLGELVVHGWDLSVGAGLDTTLHLLLVEGLWELVEPHRDDMRAMGAFGAGASGREYASLQDKLLDAYGRVPA